MIFTITLLIKNIFLSIFTVSKSDLWVLKYIKLPVEKVYTLINAIPLPNNLNRSYITKMVLHGTGDDAHIFIGTYNGIYRVPVQSCSDYTICMSCTEARDPYCSCTRLCSGNVM